MEAKGGSSDAPRTQLPTRTTRGKRIAALMDEEAEADNEFWGQDFFKEEEEDKDFVSSATEEEEDVADSDFSNSVSELAAGRRTMLCL
jgi:YL1 nuclear protein